MASATWDGQDQPMAATGEDDFHNFLNMAAMGNVNDDMQFDFNGLHDGSGHPIQGHGHGHGHGHHHAQQNRNMPDTIMSDYNNSAAMMSGNEAMMQNHGQAISSAPNQSIPAHMISPHHPPQNSISDIDAQIQYLQQQKLEQQQRQSTVYTNHNSGHSVPPTPQSLEMPPNNHNRYYSQPDQTPQSGVFDNGYRQRMKDQQDMAFTPLVSPAVTPLDPFFAMENAFTVPGAYFSPLTSPALHAQSDSTTGYDPSTHSNNSPVEMDMEPPMTTPAPQTKDLAKTARKNNAAAKARKAGVKSSPIAKAHQRRKTGPSPAIVSQVLSEADERNVAPKELSMLPMPAASTEGSDENASVSPENLSDMPPPPVPVRRSTSKSPYIQPQNGQSPVAPLNTNAARAAGQELQQQQQQQQSQQQQQQQQPHPATPASLMKLTPSNSRKATATNHEQTAIDNIESLELPESISNPNRIATNVGLGSATVHTEADSSKASTPHPLPSPIINPSGTVSASQSPQLRPGSSGPASRKTPQLVSRNGRKRSTSSVQMSPALLPRISPNIKPLLPGTPGSASAEDTMSRLLTSKSNYQNILEGNTVPGVSYPHELSTNLNLKRTSHKIAEQGRRNRINSALQVMAGLLPDQQSIASGDEADKKDGKQANAANSKASVVENAIAHMKNLQQENVDLRHEIHKLREQLEKME